MGCANRRRAREEFHTGGLIVLRRGHPFGCSGPGLLQRDLKVIALDSRRVLSQCVLEERFLWTAEFGPDGRMLAFAGSDGLRIAATETTSMGGQCVMAPESGLFSSARTDVVYTGSEDGTARVWNVRTGVP